MNHGEIKMEPAMKPALAGGWLRTWLGRFCFAWTFVLLTEGGLAQPAAPQTSATASTELNLEDLINLQVTSVSKKEEKLSDAATAITVLNNDDIRRSGATSVMEALRMVPGADVAQV